MIDNTPDALKILLRDQPRLAPQADADLVARVYRIEERVQFDGSRTEAASEIRKVIQNAVSKDLLGGDDDRDAA